MSKLIRNLIMKKLTILLFSILISFNSYSETPSFIGGNTIKDICKIADCGESLDIYYRQHYLSKKNHKAFVIEVWDGGKAIGGSYMTWLQPNAALAKRDALKSCKREFGSTSCQVLFVNNKIADKKLYELLTTKSISTNTTTAAATSSETSSNLPKCTYNYYHNCFIEYIWDDGTKYVGEWQNNKINGQGTMTWPDGAKYVGEWQDDERTGLGKVFFPDGTTEEGVYKDGVFQYEKVIADRYATTKVSEVIPANAHASGSSWKCNTGFTKFGNSCNKAEESKDYIKELEKIKELLDSGVINEEEFKKMKQKIIDKM